MPTFDLIVRGGSVATAVDVMRADIAIADGKVAAIGHDLGDARAVVDAGGRLVTPGGVDSHCHIEQLSAMGVTNADTFETATASAALGGTTTVIPFACQHKGDDLSAIVRDYHALAGRGAIVDYALHLIVTDPTPATLTEQLPALVKAGHGSIKIFMTYDAMKVDDEQVLDILLVARQLGAMVCAHAENHGMIKWMVQRLLDRGYTAPKYHAVSHPRGSEAEAFNRLIAMSELIDQPIMIFHVSTAEGAATIHAARGRGVKVFAETCPQYLFLTAEDLDKPGMEGAKWCCSPPPRAASDIEALWQALARGDLQTVTSDHAPFSYDEKGKFANGPNPTFKQIPNGMPGLQARMPLMFDAIVSQGRMDVTDFVRITATAPAQLYNLADRKGSIAISKDADLVVWDTEREVTLTDDLMADATGYTPYVGRTVKGWPETVVRRGEVIVADGALTGRAGSGEFLPRGGGKAAEPTGRTAAEFDPARNFGAVLL
ncbi:dihydropyrimidinase [Acuticoccus sp. I52.16.1]|uniref:dihydropyrimidinase n=1 Tax=Acuticoccus sp. I52.16.1 TaxID=2928472 RepID=UPI001FD3C224|nr:dihydropyrimidinase [Acuticoccus sp. I52.16.1]UOM34502.1 dihydropyrimidinase [Acuticoccus sp. I52.16.1]